MKVEILEEAREELNQAVARYEEIEPGLGIRLKEEARRDKCRRGKAPTRLRTPKCFVYVLTDH